MRILFTNSTPHIPQKAGGVQSTMHDLVGELAKCSHEVSILSGVTKSGWIGLRSRLERKLRRRGFSVDCGLGYPVYRGWFPWELAAEVSAQIKADVVVAHSGAAVRFAQALAGMDIRVVIYLHNVMIEELGGDPRDLHGVSYIANSHFTARRWKDLFDIDSDVVYPLIRRENYETETTRENVTFINPHPLKGQEIALGVAERCPEIPFVFVESWGLEEHDMERLRQRIALLPNITLKPRTQNMKSIYGKARIVLAPSQLDEAFGRVAVEPQFSGIPVVASARGGLPEAVGPGGILIDQDASADTWAKAVEKLWHDQAYYAEKSQAARAHANRSEMNPTEQIERLLAIFSKPGQNAARG